MGQLLEQLADDRPLVRLAAGAVSRADPDAPVEALAQVSTDLLADPEGADAPTEVLADAAVRRPERLPAAARAGALELAADAGRLGVPAGDATDAGGHPHLRAVLADARVSRHEAETERYELGGAAGHAQVLRSQRASRLGEHRPFGAAGGRTGRRAEGVALDVHEDDDCGHDDCQQPLEERLVAPPIAYLGERLRLHFCLQEELLPVTSPCNRGRRVSSPVYTRCPYYSIKELKKQSPHITLL